MVTALRELGPRIVFSDFHSLAFALPACRALGLPLVFLCWGWWFRPRPWQRAFFRKGPTTILALSEAIKSGFLGTPPFMPPDRIRVLHPGVDISRFRPRPRARIEVRRELGLVADVRLVTLLARFQTVKGHEVFLAAARRMAGRSPGVRFVIAGESIFGHAADEALKRRVISRVQKDPLLRERVKLLGWVAGPEELLAASDVLVCSSRFESFGMVLVEAMASGVAVVSTWVGGPAEIVIDGETGYLVPPGRPDLIADRVLNLLEDEDLRTRMGAAGRIRARDRFSLRRYADSFSSLLESIAGPA
jgi:glycosyltransferase involved in cell wall biosynthesis